MFGLRWTLEELITVMEWVFKDFVEMFPLYACTFLGSSAKVKLGLWIYLTYSCDFQKMSGLGYEGLGT